MSREAITEAIGPRAAVRLARKCGGAGLYVATAKPNYAEVRADEVEAMKRLYLQGYYYREIAPLLGRSVQTVSCFLYREMCAGRLRRLPKPRSARGQIVRAQLRREAQQVSA